MQAVCTHCSRDKSHAPGAIAAADRYRSPRIRALLMRARSQGVAFYILSGKHGLLAPQDPIADYDLLLTAGAAPDHARLVARQLRERGVTELDYITAPLDNDPQLAPYRATMAAACALSGVRLRVEELRGAPGDGEGSSASRTTDGTRTTEGARTTDGTR
jgi:hypothetical protein